MGCVKYPIIHFFKTMQEKQRREELAIQHIQGLRGCPLHKAGISTSGPLNLPAQPRADEWSWLCHILSLLWMFSHLSFITVLLFLKASFYL